jgi:hypothetical protein
VCRFVREIAQKSMLLVVFTKSYSSSSSIITSSAGTCLGGMNLLVEPFVGDPGEGFCENALEVFGNGSPRCASAITTGGAIIIPAAAARGGGWGLDMMLDKAIATAELVA